VKKYFFVLFLCFIFLSNINAADNKVDKIPIFMQYYQEGQAQDSYSHMEIMIYKNNGKIKWIINVEEFSQDDESKATIVDISNSHSDDDWSDPFLKILNWIPGKKLECKYLKSGFDMILTAQKSDKGPYFWDVNIKGFIPRGSGGKMEAGFKQVKEINLKYKKLEFVARYNDSYKK